MTATILFMVKTDWLNLFTTNSKILKFAGLNHGNNTVFILFSGIRGHLLLTVSGAG